MSGPLDTALASLYLTDSVGGSGGSVYAAASFNNPYKQIAFLVDAHLAGAVAGAVGEGGATIYHHRDTDIVSHADYTGATARSVAIVADTTAVNTILDQLVAAWAEITGETGSAFHTASAGDWVDLKTIKTLSVAANTANAWLKRDANGGGQLTYLGVIPTITGGGANVPGVEVDAPTGWVSSFFIGKLNGVTKFNADQAGNLTLTGTLTAASLALTTSLFAAIVSDYRPGVSGTAGHIAVAAGGAIPDSGGNQVGPVGAPLDLNIVGTFPQPSGSNSQYLALSIPVGWNGTAANLVAAIVAGTAAGSPAKPSMPTGNVPLGWLLWRGPSASAGSGANAGGVFLLADIIDARFGGGGGLGGGSGTTDAALRALGLMTFGSPGVAGGGQRMDTFNAAAYVHSTNVRDSATQASPGAVLRNMLQVDLLSRLTNPTGSTIQLLASAAAIQPGPFSADINGARYTTTATLVGDASGMVAGTQVKLCLDITSGALALTFLGAATNPNYATQQVIQQYQLDGSKNLLPVQGGNGATVTFAAWPDNTPQGMIDGPQVRRREVKITDTGTGGSFTPGASFATNALVPSGTFSLPARCQGKIYVRMWGNKSAGTSEFLIAPLIDGGQVDATAFIIVPTAQTGDFTVFATFEIPPLNALVNHTIGLAFEKVAGTDVLAIYANGTKVWAEFDGI